MYNYLIRYKQLITSFTLACTFLLVGTVSFSQEEVVDSTATYTDTDTSTLEQLNEYKNVEEEKYNYYDYLIYWPTDSIAVRQVPDSAITALKAQDDFWYVDKDFRKKIEPDPKGSFWLSLLTSSGFRILIWTIIIGGFAAVLIWFLVNSNVRLFGKKAVELSTAEEFSDNIFEINYAEEIEKAVRAGNYRLATRLLFLRLLRNFSDKNIIQYKDDATNHDYLMQISNSSYYKDFFKVTRYYEYAWYGGFDVNEELYTTIKRDFDSLDERINNN